MLPHSAAVECRSLTKCYGRVKALDGLDLTVNSNTVFGLLGPNGAGKTTLLKILTGLSRPGSGAASVAGEEVTPNSLSLQRKIGYLPEEPSFYNWMTGIEYLTFTARLLRFPGREARKRTAELLEQVDLVHAARRKIGGYSRGMRQRLGLAQALLNRPAVLFLDEPCSALDPAGRAEVLDTLAGLKGQATTVLMSSHILADVERACDQVAIMDKGRLVVQSGVRELRQKYARPVIEVQFDEPADAFCQALGAHAWVEKALPASADSSMVTVRARDLDRARRELPGLVASSGLTLRQYRLAEPTLEEVFIQLTEDRRLP